jgi:RND superfamily putative drug exporter
MFLEEDDQNALPYIMIATVIAVGCLVAASFSSAFLAIKLFFTVFIPILADYGLLVGIYDHGWLSWLGIQKLIGVPWPMLFTTGPLLFALAIDYDMFLFARVYELRLNGYENRASVRIALEETGPPITIAGSLMCAAFLFAFLLDLPMVSETGLLYFIGIGIDTFVVRMWVAPAVLCMFEALNYWPQKMPNPVKGYEDYDYMGEGKDAFPMFADEAAIETKGEPCGY